MLDTPKEVAAKILAKMRELGTQSTTLVPARLENFPYLDAAAYASAQTRLERASFRHLGDLELLEVSRSPGTLILPTAIRAMASDDGNISSEFYEVRNRRSKLLGLLLKGLVNFRWLDAPVWFTGAMRIRHCAGFETEFTDGSWVATSNSEGAAAISSPPSIDARFFPYATSFDVLLEHHRQKVRAKLAAGAEVRPCHSLDEFVAAQVRMRQVKNAYRHSIDWLTRGELHAMSTEPKLADAVFEEIRAELAKGSPGANAGQV